MDEAEVVTIYTWECCMCMTPYLTIEEEEIPFCEKCETKDYQVFTGELEAPKHDPRAPVEDGEE